MAKTKTEFEADRAQYYSHMEHARAAEAAGNGADALTSAIASWEYIDGMMQYERRYERKEFEGIAAIDLVLKYAPLLLRFEAIDKLQVLLKTYKRIDRLASDDLVQEVSDARARLRQNHLLYSSIEQDGGARQEDLCEKLGGEPDYWRSVVEDWVAMGLVRREAENGSYRLSLVTRLRQLVQAKCSACGHVMRSTKVQFLADCTCPNCGVSTSFVLMPKLPNNEQG